MGREQLRMVSDKNVLPFIPFGLLYWLGAVVVSVPAWELLRYIPPGTPIASAVIGPLALHAALTMLLERGLAATPLRFAWRYRLAFLLSSGLAAAQHISHPALHLLFPAQYAWPALPVFPFVCALVGAFLGGLISTAIHEGLWENNSPPSAEISADVLNIHRTIIGVSFNENLSKRLFDVALAFWGLILSAPFWLLSIFLIWIEDPGPILFVKNSVGRGGKNFHQYKLRTMVTQAEKDTGPVLAQEKDERTLWIGRFLRKTALDELPQLINILQGEMSFVGPRPQRTVLVHEYIQRMPEYTERHRVRPGIAGLAQVAGDYYLTPRQKLRFDRLYIQYANLGFDLKLLFLACAITFWYRWRKGWNGRLPRAWL